MMTFVTYLLLPTIIITYKPGGETAQEAMERVGGVEVMGGGYFAYAKGIRHSIDLVIVEGETVIKYRSDLQRPVLVISKSGNIRIDRQYKEQEGDLYAVAGAEVPADPNNSRRRQIFVLSPPRFIKLTGTHKYCSEKLKGEDFIYMDGGSSVLPTAKLPSHIVRLKWINPS